MSNEPYKIPPLGPMSSQRWWRMTLKELREILRDRRTIITLIGMPLLIYPLLGVTFQKLLVSQVVTNKTQTEYRVAFENPAHVRILRHAFQQYDTIQARLNGTRFEIDRAPAGTPDDPVWTYLMPDSQSGSLNIEQCVSDRMADVGIRIKADDDDGPWDFQLIYRSSSALSLDARRAIEDRLKTINESESLERLHEFDPQFAMPLRFQRSEVASTDAGTGFSIATLIPLILILMTVTGAVYPAIDLTAGERERGTLEALISAPVPRHELLFAKFLAVLTVALLTAIANLTSMVVTAYSNGMENLLFGAGGIKFSMLAVLLGLLIIFAGFFASVILILTSFARSFKEAQAYLIPVMLVSLAPGVLCLMPGIEMTGWMSVTPLVNIVILARDVVDGRAQPIWIVTSLLSTVLYSAVALSTAAKIFGTDAVLYGSEGSWADLTRRPATPQPAASLSQAIALLALLFPAFLVLSGIPRRFSEDSVAAHLFGNATITILLFAVVPVAFARWSAIDLGRGLRMRGSSAICFLAALILGLSLWPFAVELALLQSNSFEQPESIQKLFAEFTERLNSIPVPAKLLALAVVPAVCEELFFRGYLLTSFRSGMSAPLAIAFSGCLFGLFHIIQGLGFERFAPTCFLGLVLGWVCWQTESVLPGMLLHTTHNSLLLIMQTYAKELTAMGIGTELSQHIPTTWLMAAAVAVGVAVTTMIAATQNQTHPGQRAS